MDQDYNTPPKRRRRLTSLALEINTSTRTHRRVSASAASSTPLNSASWRHHGSLTAQFEDRISPESFRNDSDGDGDNATASSSDSDDDDDQEPLLPTHRPHCMQNTTMGPERSYSNQTLHYDTTPETQTLLSAAIKKPSSITSLLIPRSNRHFGSLHHWSRQLLKAMPPLFLGVLLNLLDAISYGMLIFPAGSTEIFDSSFAVSGISMFMVSTIICQLVFSLGGSKFQGANGSMMIEVIPFFHQICQAVGGRLGDDKAAVISTVVFVYVSSTMMTGLVFFLLGWFKAGAVVNFFPRPLLIGTIGGIGLFLIKTAIEVSSQSKWEWTVAYVQYLFSASVVPVWTTSIGLTILLQISQRFIRHPLLVPGFFCLIPAVFYSIISAIGVSMQDLRSNMWVLNVETDSDTKFYSFWSLIQWQHIDWTSVYTVAPTVLALIFFGILHVPINLPALAITTRQEKRFDINHELMGHGVSNMLSACALSVQNYVVYSTSVIFIRLGGDSRLATLLLAACTTVLYVVGLQLVNYIPTILVSTLILHLGLDLAKESLIDSYPRMDKAEFLVIVAVMVMMIATDFTIGTAVGCGLSVLIFLANYARSPMIHTQSVVETEDVRIHTMSLQSYLFFGNAYKFSKAVDEIIGGMNLELGTVVLTDFQTVTGVDFSFVTEFSKSVRSLHDIDGVMMVCGVGNGIKHAFQRGGVTMVDKDDENARDCVIMCTGSLEQAMDDAKSLQFTG